MKLSIFSFLLLAFAFAVSCSSINKETEVLPDNDLCDTAKVSFMIDRVSPDSVARFICNSAIGLNPKVQIDSMHQAVLYAYNRYSGDDLAKFGRTFDSYADSLPLNNKMKLLYQTAIVNPDKLGYRLGLDYAMSLQSKAISISDIDKEVEAFKAACGDDEQTYLRFLNGLSIALNMPEYSHLPQEVLIKYGKKVNIPYRETPANAGEQ